MERFKQLQHLIDKEKGKEKAASLDESLPPKLITGPSLAKPAAAIASTTLGFKANGAHKPNQGGKLAFCLKHKSKLGPPPVKLAADDDDDGDEKDAGKCSDDTPAKRQKLGQPDVYQQSSNQADGGN